MTSLLAVRGMTSPFLSPGRYSAPQMRCLVCASDSFCSSPSNPLGKLDLLHEQRRQADAQLFLLTIKVLSGKKFFMKSPLWMPALRHPQLDMGFWHGQKAKIGPW